VDNPDQNYEKPLNLDQKLFFQGEKLQNNVHDINQVHHLDLSQAIDPVHEEIERAKQVIDAALIGCGENPAALATPEFAEALALVYANPALKFEYRDKIKSSKPSGVPMADIDSMAEPERSANGDQHDSVATELIELVMGSGALCFDVVADKAFISTTYDGIERTMPIGGKEFVDWVSFKYYTETKAASNFGKSASESAIKQAGLALSGIAKHDGENQRVHLRVADSNEGHYLYVGDQSRQIIEISPTGWRLIRGGGAVKFWQPSSMQSLPIPATDGDLSKLWSFINIPEPVRLLVLAWLLECFRAETPKPILALNGTQGSAKSSTQNKLRQLIDNNSVNLRAAPKSVEDVFVSAGCNWLASFENLSHITPAMQDALCTLATGGGFASRTLYTNADETIIEVRRPVIINSIPNVITAQDLTDRAISIELPPIVYREEAEISAEWETAKPGIFGGLLDLFVKTLALLPSVKLVNPPRMADFTRLGEAMAQALGHPAGTFDALYKANRAESIGRALEASPVAVAVRDMTEAHTGSSALVFSGTMKNLLDTLDKHKHESTAWPKSPRGLGDVLRRQQPALSSLGIGIEISKPGKHGVNVEIKKKNGEHGFKDLHAKRKVLHTNSMANDVEVF